jgi:hypothetical protein
MLYEVITGAPPFLGDNVVQTILQHLNKQPVSFENVSIVNPVSKRLEAITMKCLEKVPERRYQTVYELIDALELIDSATTYDARARLRRRDRLRKCVRFLRRYGFALLGALLLLAGSIAAYGFHQDQVKKEAALKEWISKANVAGELDHRKVSIACWKEAIKSAEALNRPSRELADLHAKLAFAIDKAAWRQPYKPTSDQFKKALQLYGKGHADLLEKIKILGVLVERDLRISDYLNKYEHIEAVLTDYPPIDQSISAVEIPGVLDGDAAITILTTALAAKSPEVRMNAIEQGLIFGKRLGYRGRNVDAILLKSWRELDNLYQRFYSTSGKSSFQCRLERSKVLGDAPEQLMFVYRSALAIKDDPEDKLRMN